MAIDLLKPLLIPDGGTGAITAVGVRTSLGAAASGANSDITSLSALSTPLSVPQGGTGAITFNTHGVLLGEGTSAIVSTTAGTSGQPLLSGGASADPAYGALNLAGGSTIVTGILPTANGGVDQTAWTVWTPSYTGFSVPPASATARYKLIGKTCVCIYTRSTAGTSNATTFTLTLPVAASGSVPQYGVLAATEDGSAFVAAGTIGTRQNSTTADLYTQGFGAWTASGLKDADFSFTYETA
jgi:hypothetical protein